MNTTSPGSAIALAALIILFGANSSWAQSYGDAFSTQITVEGTIGDDVELKQNVATFNYRPLSRVGQTFNGFRRSPRVTPVKVSFKQDANILKGGILIFIPDYQRKARNSYNDANWIKTLLPGSEIEYLQDKVEETHSLVYNSQTDAFSKFAEVEFDPEEIENFKVPLNSLKEITGPDKIAKIKSGKAPELVSALEQISKKQIVLSKIWTIENDTISEGYTPCSTEKIELINLYRSAAILENDEFARAYYTFMSNIIEEKLPTSFLIAESILKVSPKTIKPSLSRAFLKEFYSKKAALFGKFLKQPGRGGFIQSVSCKATFLDALQALNSGQSQVAESLFEKLYKENPKDITLTKQILNAHNYLNPEESSICRWIERYLALNPKDLEISILKDELVGEQNFELDFHKNSICYCGKIHGWEKCRFPLTVFVEKDKYDRVNYRTLVIESLSKWKDFSFDGFDFKLVDNKDQADIVFLPRYKEFESEIAGRRCLGRTYRTCLSGKLLRAHVEVILNKTNAYLNEIIMHETGHALGLGHTSDIFDIMYPNMVSHKATLSKNDRRSIYALYRGNSPLKIAKVRERSFCVNDASGF